MTTADLLAQRGPFLAGSGESVPSVSPPTTVPVVSCEGSNTCYVAPLPPVSDNMTLPEAPCGSLDRRCPDASSEAGAGVDTEGGAEARAGIDASEAGTDSSETGAHTEAGDATNEGGFADQAESKDASDSTARSDSASDASSPVDASFE